MNSSINIYGNPTHEQIDEFMQHFRLHVAGPRIVSQSSQVVHRYSSAPVREIELRIYMPIEMFESIPGSLTSQGWKFLGVLRSTFETIYPLRFIDLQAQKRPHNADNGIILNRSKSKIREYVFVDIPYGSRLEWYKGYVRWTIMEEMNP